MSSDDDMFVDAHDLQTKIKTKYIKSKSNTSTSSGVYDTNRLKEEEEEERQRPNDESTS